MRYIVYSKNRACQLDAHIRSALEFVEDLEMIYVIYKCSTAEFEAGYNKLKKKIYPNVTLIEEDTFKNTLMKVSNELPVPYWFAMGDDDYWVKKTVMLPLIELFLANNQILNFTNRMSDKITKRGVVLSEMPFPEFIQHDDFLVWDWTKCEMMHDWGYPVGTTNSGFLKAFILPWIKNLDYINSGWLEGQWNTKMRDTSRPLMCSFNDCKVVNLPLNRVVDGPKNPHGEFEIADLNREYLAGKVIDLQSIVESRVEDAYMNYEPNLRLI
jgi:hypothetical protein